MAAWLGDLRKDFSDARLELGHWWRWSILWTAVPLAAGALIIAWQKQGMPSGTDLVGKGDLFLIGIALFGGGLGELGRVEHQGNRRSRVETLRFWIVVLLVFYAIIWALITAQLVQEKTLGKLSWVATEVGVGALIVAALMAAICVATASGSKGAAVADPNKKDEA